MIDSILDLFILEEIQDGLEGDILNSKANNKDIIIVSIIYYSNKLEWYMT